MSQDATVVVAFFKTEETQPMIGPAFYLLVLAHSFSILKRA